MALFMRDHVLGLSGGEDVYDALCASVEAFLGTSELRDERAVRWLEELGHCAPAHGLAEDGAGESSSDIRERAMERVSGKEAFRTSSERRLAMVRVEPRVSRSFVERALEDLHGGVAELEPALRILTQAMQYCSAEKMWRHKHASPQEFAVLTIVGVLDNDALQSVSPQDTFCFFALVLESLWTYAPAAYDEAIKHVMNYFLEKRQQPHLPSDVRETNLLLGAQLLELRVRHAMNLSIDENASLLARVAGDPSACRVLDLYASGLTGASLRIPQLWRLLGMVLCHDAIKASNAHLAICNMRKRGSDCVKAHRAEHGGDVDLEPLARQLVADTEKLCPMSAALQVWHSMTQLVQSDDATEVSPLLGAYVQRAMSFIAPFYPAPALATHGPIDINGRGGGSSHTKATSAASAAYRAYSERITGCVVQLRNCMATFVEEYPGTLRSFPKQTFVHGIGSSVEPVPSLLASASPEITSATEDLLREAWDVSYSRFELLHALFLERGALALSGMYRFLRTFALVTDHVSTSVHLARCTIRLLDDAVHVLCDRNIGLLVPYIPWDLHTPGASEESNPYTMVLAVWAGICEAIEHTFKHMPSWSRNSDRKELIGWLAHVPKVASYMVKSSTLVREALQRAGCSDDECKSVLNELTVPVDGAVSWLRLNHDELLQQLYDYLRRTLELFSAQKCSMPGQATHHALEFIRSQLAIKDSAARKTLLSTAQLEVLEEEFLAVQQRSAARPPPPSQPKGPESTHPATPARLSQQRLPFSPKPTVIDVDAIPDKPSPKPPASGAAGFGQAARLNQFKPAAHHVRPRTLPPLRAPPKAGPPPRAGPTSKLAQLRGEFQQTRNVARRPVAPPRAFEPDEPRALPATSSVTGAVSVLPQRQAPPKQESDTSSSSEEEDDRKGGLSSLRSPHRPREAPQAREKRRVKLMEDPAVRQTMIQAREQERMRRLCTVPDFGPLHRCILSWRYDDQSELPPTLIDGHPLRSLKDLQHVRGAFEDAADYQSVFGPMLMLECWAQFQQAREEPESERPVPVIYQSRMRVDDFDEFRFATDAPKLPEKMVLTDNDVVRLQLPALAAPGQREHNLLAKVQAVRQGQGSVHITLRCTLAGNNQQSTSLLAQAKGWRIIKLFSLVTLRREYAALLSIGDLDLSDAILHARLAPKPTVAATDLRETMNRFDVNEAQARAVVSSLRTPGFSLIQGPPGTGKTKTIRAIVASILARRGRGPVKSGNAGTSGSKPGAQLLLCAPSNAAIDELASRLDMGINVDGRLIKPLVVRLGREEMVGPEVRHLTLEAEVERRVKWNPKRKAESARQELRRIEARLKAAKESMQQASSDPALARQLQKEINTLTDEHLDLRETLSTVELEDSTLGYAEQVSRASERESVMNEADVVCTTLGGAGHELLYRFKFDTVVIDEAVQAVEISALIPLRYRCTRCILVGDPKQLPPTVISQAAERLGYSQSLFVRLYNQNPGSVHLLNVQYRMHPEISVFPSTTFYGSKLSDGNSMELRTAQNWHASPVYGAFRFFDVPNTREQQDPGHSVQNREEADVAMRLIEGLLYLAGPSLAPRVGFITMYKTQVRLLRSMFRTRFGPDLCEQVAFNTVDGFQGQEKDVIIFTCVRSNPEKQIGFMRDQRRLNVALTRARSSLFVIGHAAMLRDADPVWKQLVSESQRRGFLVRATPATFSRAAIAPRPSAGKAAPVPPKAAAPPRPKRPSDESVPSAKRSHTAAASSPATPAAPPPVPSAKPVRQSGQSAPRPILPGQPTKATASRAPNPIAAPQAAATATPTSKPPGNVPSQAQSTAPPKEPGKWAKRLAENRARNVAPPAAKPGVKKEPSESAPTPGGPSWLRPSRPSGVPRQP